MTEYSPKEGAVGFILNKPISMKINELVSDFPEINSAVYYGGPVAPDTLHYLHDAGDIVDGSVHMGSGLYWSGDYEKLKFLIQSKLILPHNIRFYVGYSGWSPGQLEDELKSGSWVVTDMEANYIFKTPYHELWSEAMKNKGGLYTVIAKMPDSFLLN